MYLSFKSASSSISQPHAKELDHLVEQFPEGSLRTFLKIKRVFRALGDTQHGLHLRSAQAGVHRPRAIRGNSTVLGTMNVHNGRPIGRDEQLREYSAVGWRQCIFHMLRVGRWKERAQRAAKRGLVRAGPVVEVGALLQP